jgi:hypothetical protein
MTHLEEIEEICLAMYLYLARTPVKLAMAVLPDRAVRKLSSVLGVDQPFNRSLQTRIDT